MLPAQVGRYQQLGRHGKVVARDTRRVVVELGKAINAKLVRRAIKTEPDCCPFLEVAWNDQTRRLTIAARDSEHQPVIAAIARALGAAQSNCSENIPGGLTRAPRVI
ncbi:MAG: hypothetical protein ACRDL5_11520 [Solirubrobacteraceae bacterium]